MAIKNMAAALGDLEKAKETREKKNKLSKGKNINIKTDKNINISTDKNINSKTAKNIKHMYLTLEPAVYKKLWLHKVNAGTSISDTINQLVRKYLK